MFHRRAAEVHLIVDALGLPVDFEVTEGQRHESIMAVPLVERVRPRCLLGDEGFDTNPFRDLLAKHACIAVIPCQGNRTQPVPYDKELYRARADLECAFNLLKHASRFATRYEKTLRRAARARPRAPSHQPRTRTQPGTLPRARHASLPSAPGPAVPRTRRANAVSFGAAALGLVPGHEAQAVLASLDRLAAMLTRLRGFGH